MGSLNFIVYFFALVLAIFFSSTFSEAGTIGVNYGRIADNLPSPESVVQLLRNNRINRVKIFDSDAPVLRALSGSGIKVIVGLPNEQLADVARDQNAANQWVERNVRAYYPSTEIIAIAVGNEIINGDLVLAMRNIQTALRNNNLPSTIKVSSPLKYDVFENTFPPSKGRFRGDVQAVIRPMLEFLSQTGSYLMVNIYPFFAYVGNPNDISLNYATFGQDPGVVDPNNQRRYSNLFDAQVDAAYAAISNLGYPDLKLVVTESGWPSVGDQIGASVPNAGAYNRNLVNRVLNGGGTPSKPNDALDVYIFALFNENQKPGLTSERNFGLFYPNQQMVYPISFTGVGGPGGNPPAPDQTWCVANGNVDRGKLQEALDYACGQGGADCGPIQPGASCYNPNTLEGHASYAFNSYYQKQNRGAGTCNFGGTARIVNQSPSTYFSLSSNRRWTLSGRVKGFCESGYGNCVYPTGP